LGCLAHALGLHECREVSAEALFVITTEALYLAYVDFEAEELVGFQRLHLSQLLEAEVGSLSSKEAKALGLHLRASLSSGPGPGDDEDPEESAAQGPRQRARFPALRLHFKVGEQRCTLPPFPRNASWPTQAQDACLRRAQRS
jgi:hypothetical protein